MAGRPLRIGITLGLGSTSESLWLNGIKQNALALAKLFKGSPHGHHVLLLNTTDVPLTSDLPWDSTVFETRRFADGWQGLDVLLELGGQIDPEQTDWLKRQGTKVVSYCCGAEYVQNMEAMLFGRRLYDFVFVNQRYDEVWIIPQLWSLNRGFFETLRRCPSRQVPFVWDPSVLEARARHLPNGGEYQPRSGPKRLSVMEPNIDVLKFCLYPIFIAERAFREAADRIAFLHVANAQALASMSPEFILLMNNLDIVKAGRASFVGRMTTPDFLSEHTDIVISHQWELPLNYLYLECCWQGYPLVHNSEAIADLGYYYPESDLQAATRQLVTALTGHDDVWAEYTARQRAGIRRFHAEDPGLIGAYDDLLFALVDGRPA